MDITVKFKNLPELYIELNDNPTVKRWLQLFKDNYSAEFPIFRDMQKYSLSYLKELVAQANDDLGWSFTQDINSIDDTVLLHKHIETTLANGFSSIPAEFDNLLHELHFCLHMVEYNCFTVSANKRTYFLLEWFNNDGFDLDETFDHMLFMKFGDIRLQNPFVGHVPLQIYSQNDASNVFQTCKFHNFVRPGMYIETRVEYYDNFSPSQYIRWWNTNAPEFVEKHGIERILHYTGHPVIGRVTNLDDLTTVVNSTQILELENVSFQ